MVLVIVTKGRQEVQLSAQVIVELKSNRRRHGTYDTVCIIRNVGRRVLVFSFQ